MGTWAPFKLGKAPFCQGGRCLIRKMCVPASQELLSMLTFRIMNCLCVCSGPGLKPSTWYFPNDWVIPCLGSTLMLAHVKFVNWVLSMWYHRTSHEKAKCPLLIKGSSGLTSHGCLLCPPHISSSFSVVGCPTGGPVIKEDCDFLQVSLRTTVPWRVVNHPTWNGILHVWKRAPFGSNPPPSTQVMQLHFLEHTLQRTQERSLSKGCTFLPAACFPLSQYTELKGEDGKHFLGPVQYMYSLTFLFGYKTIKGVNFKSVLIFFPFMSSWAPHVLEENVRRKWDQKRQTQKQLVNSILHSLFCKGIQIKVRKLFKWGNIKD